MNVKMFICYLVMFLETLIAVFPWFIVLICLPIAMYMATVVMEKISEKQAKRRYEADTDFIQWIENELVPHLMPCQKNFLKPHSCHDSVTGNAFHIYECEDGDVSMAFKLSYADKEKHQKEITKLIHTVILHGCSQCDRCAMIPHYDRQGKTHKQYSHPSVQ